MRTIDLNADLGELDDGSLDAAVMPFISSANIACGAHAGNPESMRRTVRLAKASGVAVGAHPGYPDLENFGRISMALSIDELCAVVADQILLLKSIDPALRFIVFSGSETARAAEDAGLVAVHEVFADRAYTEEGRLRPRSEPGAVLHEEADCLDQAARFVGGKAGLFADSICVHGDNPSAVSFVARLRDFFLEHRISVQSAGHLDFRFARLGEQSLLAQLPSRISKSTHRAIRALQLALEGIKGVIELVPCYAELKVDWFDCGGLNTFLTGEFTVSSKSDRTGIRLDGAPLSMKADEQMVSAGIAMGTIQVPPSGLPMIMMADHPTTGGYPRIGHVIEDDLPVLAQMKPGDRVCFVESS